MFSRLTIFAAASIATIGVQLATAGTAQAQEMVALTATGPWTVDEEDWQCSLNRRIANGTENGIFSVTVKPITKTYWMKIATEGGKGRRDSGKTEVFLDGKYVANDVHYNIFKASNYRVRDVMLDFAKVDLGEVNERIRIKTSKHGDIELSASNISNAWDALETCRNGLQEKLAVDSTALSEVSVPAEGNFFKAIGMPPRPRNVDFTIFYWVETDGSVSGCKLLKESGLKGYDKKVCSNLEKKGKFTPARNADGESIRSPVFQYVPFRVAISVG